MRFVTILLSVLCLSAPATAGLFRDSIDMKDLALLSPQALERLKDAEFAVFAAQVQLAGAKAAEENAKGSLKTANRTLEVEELDFKAAKTEHKAAVANKDAERIVMAEAALSQAKHDIQAAERLVGWKKKEADWREVLVRTAKNAVDLAEAERDLARVRLLKAEDVSAAAEYDEADYAKKASERQRDHGKSVVVASKRQTQSDSARVAWETVAPAVTD